MNEWDKLNIFYYVARAESFTQAAKDLNISQPSLSRTIKSLEDRLNSQLFERTARGVQLTKEGKILYKHVSIIVSEVDAAMKFIDGKEDEPKGEVRILTTHGLSYTWLIYFMPEFLNRYPLVRLNIKGSDESRNIDEFDAAILPYIPNRPDLIQRHITTFHMKLFASKDYLEKFGIPKTPEELKKHRLITYGEGAPNPYGPLDWFARFSQDHIPYIQINSAQGRLTSAKLGLGIVELGKDHPTLENIDLVEILPQHKGPTIEFYYIYPKTMHNSKRITVLGNYLEENLEKINAGKSTSILKLK